MKLRGSTRHISSAFSFVKNEKISVRKFLSQEQFFHTFVIGGLRSAHRACYFDTRIGS